MDVVRRMFDAFSERDVDALMTVLHPDVVFISHATAELAGRKGPYRGHEGIRQYFADVELVWDALEVDPVDFRAAAGSVVIFGRVRGRRRGELLDTAVVWTWRLRDGLVSWGSVFPTPEPTPRGRGEASATATAGPPGERQTPAAHRLPADP